MGNSKYLGRLVFVLIAIISVTACTVVWGQEDQRLATPGEILVDLGFGTGMDRQTRDLTGQAEVFPAGTDRIFCRMQIQGMAAPTTVTHVWYRDGKTMAEVHLNVGSFNWRTWSSKRLLPTWTGFWEVKVLDQAGKVLASAAFDVK